MKETQIVLFFDGCVVLLLNVSSNRRNVYFTWLLKWQNTSDLMGEMSLKLRIAHQACSIWQGGLCFKVDESWPICHDQIGEGAASETLFPYSIFVACFPQNCWTVLLSSTLLDCFT